MTSTEKGEVNILMSGASGFLGTVLASVLRESGFVISEVVSKDASRINIICPFALSEGNYEFVIHAAGKAHSVPKTRIEKQEFYRVNVDGTKNLCHALERSSQLPKSFIFISTVSVYGVDEGELIQETHPLNGITPYAESKILAEEWLRQWVSDKQVTLGILRLPLIAGPNPPGNLGAMIRGIKSGRYLSIGQADARKSVVWAKDVAHIIPRLAQTGGTYNLTDGYHPTFGELEEAIATALNKKKPVKVPYWVANCLGKIGDGVGKRFPINSDKLKKITSTLTFDDTKARNELGWSPTTVLSAVGEWLR